VARAVVFDLGGGLEYWQGGRIAAIPEVLELVA
jgi:hypothetical protein